MSLTLIFMSRELNCFRLILDFHGARVGKWGGGVIKETWWDIFGVMVKTL